MRLRPSTFLGAVALAAAHPGTATAAAPSAAQVDPEARQAALKLAAVLYSAESQIALAERVVDTQIAATFRADENFQLLEREHPGFIDAVVERLKPAMVRFTTANLPDYHDRVAALFASSLSRADIEDLTRFYLSPTGRKLIAGMAENLTLESMLSEAAKNPDKPTSYAAVAKDHQASVQRVIPSLDASDRDALRALTNKPYFLQLALLGPAMRKLEQDFANEPAPEFEKEVETIIETTLAQFEGARRKP